MSNTSTPTMMTVHDLYVATAKHLTGYSSVRIRWMRPAIREYDGTVHNKHGVITIDINPNLSDGDKMYVFLHECGHARSHGSKLAAKHIDYPPASISLNDEVVKRVMNDKKTIGTIESMAGYWCGIWMQFCDKKYQRWMSYYGMSEEEARLRSLLEWTG